MTILPRESAPLLAARLVLRALRRALDADQSWPGCAALRLSGQRSEGEGRMMSRSVRIYLGLAVLIGLSVLFLISVVLFVVGVLRVVVVGLCLALAWWLSC